MKPLTPPDLEQCQVEKPNGNSFMTFGGVPGLERCTNKPTVVVTETKPASDGQIGSMSLCDDCLTVFKGLVPADFATIRRLDEERKLRDIVDAANTLGLEPQTNSRDATLRAIFSLRWLQNR